MKIKKTLILGASTNPNRYSHMAALRLMSHGHEVVLVGLNGGVVNSINIQQGLPELNNIDTITLYVGPKNQVGYYEYIVGLKPHRVIFNPGTENPELYKLLRENNIEFTIACTLVMLSVGNY